MKMKKDQRSTTQDSTGVHFLLSRWSSESALATHQFQQPLKFAFGLKCLFTHSLAFEN